MVSVTDDTTETSTDSLWVWDTDTPRESPAYFHEYCTLNPFDVTDDVPFMLDFGASRGDHGGQKPFAATLFARVLTYAFRHAPLLVVVAGTVLTLQAALTPLNGLEVLIPGTVGLVPAVVGGAVLLYLTMTVLLALIFSSADGDDALRRTTVGLVHAGVVYGVFTVLLAGATWSAWTVYTTPTDALEPNVVYSFGFLLLVYVGGPLVYDGMRRTETLFKELDSTDLLRSRPDRERFTEEFLPRFDRAFGLTAGPIPVVVLVAVLFVSQFVVVWTISRGPFVLNTPTSLAIVTAIDVAVVVLAVQFVLLVRFLNELLSEDGITLRYMPGHEDDAGGFRDFGRFATRVNSLLVLAGIYLAYRLHVQGTRDPLGPATSVSVTAWDPFVWVLSYTVPVVVYGAVIGVWLYFSFWQIHRKMVRDKRRRIQQERSTEGESREDIETLQTYRAAPEWPINDRLLVTVLSIDVISVVLSMLSLL